MHETDHGRFCWHDLMSTHPEDSLAFYGQLLGWTVKEESMGGQTYSMLHSGETPIGGIVPLDPDESLPTHWIAYVNVDDIEATCARIQETGGGVCVPPTDIGPGTFAVVNDPQGGLLSIWKAKEPLTPEPAKGTPHIFGWNECLSSDAGAGTAFYCQVFGWRSETHRLNIGGQNIDYHVLYRGQREHAGIMDLPPPAVAEGAGTHWLNYVNVDDVDAAAEKAVSLGADLLCPCTDIPDTGRFCVIRDPQGGMLSLFTYATLD